jgi:DNA-binding IclR family transcriptional regulator
MDEQSEKYSIKAVSRCLKILDLMIATEEPITIQSVCGELDINSNMAFRLLSTMVKSNFLVKDEQTNQYFSSLKFVQLSYKALMAMEIRRVAMPYLEMLWQQFPKANFSIGVFYNGKVIVVDHIDSQTPPRTYFTPGRTLPFHATALGKILTCELSEKQIDELIATQGLGRFTPTTICDTEALKKELELTKSRQIAMSRSEFMLNDNSNAVPIKDASNTTIAAISLAVFENGISSEEIGTTEHILIETGRKISYFLGHSR